jgi:hypothetical protein
LSSPVDSQLNPSKSLGVRHNMFSWIQPFIFNMLKLVLSCHILHLL